MKPLPAFAASRLPSLDGLRFIAALLVILGHGGLGLPAGDGVTYFFVLSGLLFSWLFQKEWAAHGRIDFKQFYVRRAFRIIPAFYAAILFTVLGKLALHLPVNFPHAAASALFVGNYYNAFHGHPATGFDLFWSLGVEEQFYLLWPLCFVFFMNKGPRALSRFLAASIAAVCAWRSLLALGFGVASPYLYDAFDTRFDSLALGCLAGLWVTNGKANAALARLTRTGFEPLLSLAGIVGLNLAASAFHYSVGFTLEAALMAVLIAQLVVLHDHGLWRWLNHRSLKFLGTLSYSTYLYHAWGLALAGKLKMLPLAPRVAVGVALSLGLACASYYAVERPFLSLRRRFESRFSPARTA
ncbi:MAG: acyltransferase family protein [Elusimicrobiota bacterium]